MQDRSKVIKFGPFFVTFVTDGMVPCGIILGVIFRQFYFKIALKLLGWKSDGIYCVGIKFTSKFGKMSNAE